MQDTILDSIRRKLKMETKMDIDTTDPISKQISIKGTIKIETFKDDNGDRSISFKIKLFGKLDYESETLEILRLINMLTS